MGEQPNTGAYDFPAGRTPIPNTAWVRPPDKPDMAPIAQLAIAYPFMATMWFVCVMAASPGYEFLGTLLFLLIGPPFLMGVAVAVGLPLRLNRRLSRWWLGNAPMYILLAVAGATLIISGFNTPERHIGDIDGYHFDVVTSHGGMLMGGCLIINFLVVSASFPLRFRKRPRIGRMAK